MLRRIDDQKLQTLCGTDVALYILFLRFASKFFLVVSCMNMFTTVLYLTGDPAALSYDDSVLRTWTILNSAATTWKVVTVYFICLVFVTAMVLYMIFTYMVKYQAVDNAFEEQEEEDVEEAV